MTDEIRLGFELVNSGYSTTQKNYMVGPTQPQVTTPIIGTAISDSVDGIVTVLVGEDEIVMPTNIAIKTGDTVNLTTTNGAPIVVGAIGNGDVMQGEINDAVVDAETARIKADDAYTKALLANEILNTQSLYQKFDEILGLILGREDSPFKAILDNTRLAFLQDEAVVAFINANSMHITNAVILNELRIGNYAFIPETNGALSLRRVI